MLAIVILLLISTFTASTQYYMQPAEASFSSTKNLSNTPGFSSDPQIAVSGSNIYVVWQDFTPGNLDIFFRASNDNGATFGNTINLSNNAGESGRPQIAVSGSNVYVVWVDHTPRNWDIFFRASNDNGATFGNTINLSNNVGDSSNPKRSDAPQIAVSSNNVYVVWVDHTPRNWDIFFRASNDNGATFGNTVNLSNNSGESGRPQIAVSGNNVYVVWQYSDDIYLRASNDNGATFGNTVNLSNNVVDASKNTLTPSNSTRDSSNPTRSDIPRIAVSGNNVYIVWVNYIPGKYDVVFRASNDNGATFGSAVKLDTSPRLPDLPRVAVSSNNVYVVWEDYSEAEGLDIFFRASNDNGATFGRAVNPIRNVGYSLSTPLVVSGNNIYIISSIGNIDIYFRASRDNGTRFDNAIKLSSDVGSSSDPQTVVSGNNVYVVWQDYAPRNSDIFFRTFIQSNNAEASEKMVLPTDNGSIKVEVTIDRGTLETGQPVKFTFKFLHPTTGEQLQDVNYSFMITDEKGNSVVNKSNIHTHEGIDTQSVTFSNTGLFTLAVDVAGLGIDKPYDSGHSGMASATVTVVPEFPLSILVVMAVVVGTAIAITRSKKFLIDKTERPVEA